VEFKLIEKNEKIKKIKHKDFLFMSIIYILLYNSQKANKK